MSEGRGGQGEGGETYVTQTADGLPPPEEILESLEGNRERRLNCDVTTEASHHFCPSLLQRAFNPNVTSSRNKQMLLSIRFKSCGYTLNQIRHLSILSCR